MNWSLTEAISYYKTQGAPSDQTAVISLLKEIQREYDDSIPMPAVAEIARNYEIKESYLLAIIKRIPSLRLGNSHCLELCAGLNCGKQAELASHAEKIHAASGKKFDLKFTPCMRMCGKGPNLKWNGKLYHKADIALLERLIKSSGIDF